MIPNVIKYISIDGLFRYEAWNNPTRSPKEILTRIGTLELLPVAYKENIDLPGFMQLQKRVYRLFDYYVDEINGNRVFEYREQP